MSSEGSSYDPALEPLSWLFGKWESIEAEASFPTMTTLKYRDVLEFRPTGKPIVDYQSTTWTLDTKCKMHYENGFLHIDPEGKKKVGLNVAHFFGAVEIAEGEVEGQKLRLESAALPIVSFIKCTRVSQVIRQWTLKDGILRSDVWMGTVKHPLQKHLVSTFKKIS